jgi:hypothetical protein
MTMLLVNDEQGPIGEIGTDLLEARWESGAPETGVLTLRGDSRLIPYLMGCAQNALTVVTTEIDGTERRYSVKRNRYRFACDVWTNYVELVRQ